MYCGADEGCAVGSSIDGEGRLVGGGTKDWGGEGLVGGGTTDWGGEGCLVGEGIAARGGEGRLVTLRLGGWGIVTFPGS